MPFFWCPSNCRRQHFSPWLWWMPPLSLNLSLYHASYQFFPSICLDSILEGFILVCDHPHPIIKQLDCSFCFHFGWNTRGFILSCLSHPHHAFLPFFVLSSMFICTFNWQVIHHFHRKFTVTYHTMILNTLKDDCSFSPSLSLSLQ